MSAPEAMASLYAGSANTWECDEMGHLNVRFHVARAQKGLGLIGLLAGMEDVFGPTSRATLLPLDQHIRFLREVRPGEPLTMVGGVTAIAETDAAFYLELRHGDGSPASTFHTKLAHVEPHSLRAFPWSRRVRSGLQALAVKMPEHGAPRSIDAAAAPYPGASLAEARRLGARRIGAGLVTADQTDAFGRLRSEFFIGEVSDAVPNLLHGWRQAVAAAAAAEHGEAMIAGAAVVEYRLVYREWPRLGAPIEVHSGVTALQGKTHRLSHWLVDPLSGSAYATTEAVALTFDLKTRKALQPPPAQMEALEALLTPGMSA
jgi:acyl-CoA thioester hydrolase